MPSPCRAATTFVQRGGRHTPGPCSRRCLGIRLGLPRGGSFRKRRWVPDLPCQSEPGLAPCSPHHQSHLGPGHCLGAPTCWGKRAFPAGRGVRPQPRTGAAAFSQPGTRSLPQPGPCARPASWPWSSSGCSLPSPAPQASLRTYWCAYCSSRAAQRGSCSARPWPPQTPSCPERPDPSRSCCPDR